MEYQSSLRKRGKKEKRLMHLLVIFLLTSRKNLNLTVKSRSVSYMYNGT